MRYFLQFSGCIWQVGRHSTIDPDNQTDDQYIQEVVTTGVNSNQQDDEDLMSNESYDLDDGGAVGGNGDTPIDSLIRWGRRVTGVNVNVNITSEGDSLKIAHITRTITGNFIIVGMVGGVQQTITKPYTEVLKRDAIFKRIAHTPRPRFNWKLYKVSMLDGETTTPQVGSDYVQMNKVEVYINNVLSDTFQGPILPRIFSQRNVLAVPEFPKYTAATRSGLKYSLSRNNQSRI